jgi:CRP-like cAMP-binding protein
MKPLIMATTIGNQLLERLSRNATEPLLEASRIVFDSRDTEVYREGATITHVYFPITALYSAVTISRDGLKTGSATIGREGMVGLSACLGVDFSSHTTIVQVPGRAIKVPVSSLLQQMERCQEFDRLMRLYAAYFLCCANQTIVCNMLHTVEERACRLLLMSHDRAGGGEFLLTHELLAEMLGVRRQSVSLVAKALQRAGLIAYRRGCVSVLNRVGLEAVTCECYETIRCNYERILRESTPRTSLGMHQG